MQARPISDYRRDGTTYSRESVSDTRRRTRFEIGDSLQPSLFYPQFKSLHWDNECNCSVRLFDTDYSRGILSVQPNAIEWRNGQRIARFYEHNPYAAEDGGFEFEVVLLSRPLTPRITFTLQSKEFDFFHQPALTAEEIARGDIRPEHVVNSYAVYHKTRSNNRVDGKHYRTGKAFHIFRSKSTDTNGRWVWNTLTVDPVGGFIHVDIPLDFWTTATYPVTVDPNLGYETAGASVTSHSTSRGVCGHTPAASENGTVTSISVYGLSTVGTCNYVMCLYNDNVTSGTRLDYSAQDGRSGAAAWRTNNAVVGFSLVSGTKYYVGHYHNASSAPGNMETNYDTGATADGLIYSSAYSSPPPDPATVDSSTTSKYSAYLTYTAAGGCPKSLLTLGVGCEEQNIILPSRTIFLPIIGLEWLRRRKNQASGSLSRRKS